jgi:hypothetical protein
MGDAPSPNTSGKAIREQLAAIDDCNPAPLVGQSWVAWRPPLQTLHSQRFPMRTFSASQWSIHRKILKGEQRQIPAMKT